MIIPVASNAATAGTRHGATVDLHLHSTASDGLLQPGAVVAAARAAGLSAIALTDHDTVSGIPEARSAAEAGALRVIAGVELSAEEAGTEIHILGLHIADLDLIETRLAEFRDARVERARSIVTRLAEVGLNVSFDSVLAQARGGAVGRPHVARAMVDAGVVRDFREAFDRYLSAGRSAYVPKPRLSAADAVSLVHSAGGLTFWAHPGAAAEEAWVRKLAADGLDGLEVLHPSHSADTAPRIAALVEAVGLLPTGGSDWHATPGSTRALGSQAVPAAWLERQDATLAARAANPSGPR